LSTPDIEVGGPRGSASGAEVLRDWAERAHIQMAPGRQEWRADGSLAVEQTARWLAESGELTEAQTVASAFRVVNGRVASVIRYPDLEAALSS
jgi:hypothetical protein